MQVARKFSDIIKVFSDHSAAGGASAFCQFRELDEA
jgi:hypothetical protein